MSLKRVDSTASELNDFSENNEGKKEYKVFCYFNMCISLITKLFINFRFLNQDWFV